MPRSDVIAPVSPSPLHVAVDLFAGAGGLSLGLEQSGFALGAAVERSRIAAATHRRNFHSTPVLCRDVRWLRAADVIETVRTGLEARGLKWAGEIALTAGGPPCQGYSTGGRSIADDERNGLVHDFRRLVVALGSRYFIMENVPGILFRTHRQSLRQLLRGFERSGYHVAEPCIVEASEVGLPQTRKRVLLIGWKVGETPVDVDSLLKVRRPPVNVIEAIDDLPRVEELEEALASDVYVIPQPDLASRSHYAESLRRTDVGLAKPRLWDGKTLSGCALTKHASTIIKRFAKVSAGSIDTISRFRRLHPVGLSPTLRAGTGVDHGSHTPPRPIHYRAARVITVREAARLQSFPDWFQFDERKWHAWREIGNAIPPILARLAGDFVMSALRSPRAFLDQTA